MLTKAELISQITNAKNNSVLGLDAFSLFATPEAYPLLERDHASFGPYTVTFDQVAKLLRNPADRDITLEEFLLLIPSER